MKKLLLSVAIASLMVGSAYAHAGEWWHLDATSKVCVNDMTPQQRLRQYKENDRNDVTYVKNDRGESMYGKIRPNGGDAEFEVFYHSYHDDKNGKLVTGKKSCEDVENNCRNTLTRVS